MITLLYLVPAAYFMGALFCSVDKSECYLSVSVISGLMTIFCLGKDYSLSLYIVLLSVLLCIAFAIYLLRPFKQFKRKQVSEVMPEIVLFVIAISANSTLKILIMFAAFIAIERILFYKRYGQLC